ncbi:IclR family transcriptional regulator domain-containing protein [Rhodococcus sp. NPDC055024]
MYSSGEIDEAVIDNVVENLNPMATYSLSPPAEVERSLRAIRDEGGLALGCQESRLGLTCAAAPILTDGACVAAVSVAGTVGTNDPRRFGSAVRRTVINVGRALNVMPSN